MNDRMRKMLTVVGVLLGSVFLWKAYSAWMFKRYMASQERVVTVSALRAEIHEWQPMLQAVGSLRAIKGVNVTTELAGMVQKIYFIPGSVVQENAILLHLNADAEIGQLQSLVAQAALAEMTYKRDKAQYAIHAVSKQTLDTDLQNWKSLQGQVKQQQATVDKKIIRAPFSGRLGINLVNPGQYLNPGDKIVSLQTLDPIYVDFSVPQQTLTQLAAGQMVVITTDALPQKKFMGKITTIDPALDTTTRNVQVEATIANPTHELVPGMFASVQVLIGTHKKYLTIPQAAVSYNSYGNLVYIIEELAKDKNSKAKLIVKQSFITTGETRGDQVAVLKGLKQGDMVVTSGQLKLKNGSRVAINNAITPANDAAPLVANEHEG